MKKHKKKKRISPAILPTSSIENKADIDLKTSKGLTIFKLPIKIFKTVLEICGAIAILVTILPFFPKLTLEMQDLSQYNDFKTAALSIINSSYLPIENIDIVIHATNIKSDSGSSINGNKPMTAILTPIEEISPFDKTSTYLNDLNKTISIPGNIISADLVIFVRYQFPLLPTKFYIKKRFVADVGFDKAVIWRNTALLEKKQGTEVENIIMTNFDWKLIEGINRSNPSIGL